MCRHATDGSDCYLCYGTGHLASLGVTLNNLFDVAASMTAFVVAAWIWTTFHRLLSIPV